MLQDVQSLHVFFKCLELRLHHKGAHSHRLSWGTNKEAW